MRALIVLCLLEAAVARVAYPWNKRVLTTTAAPDIVTYPWAHGATWDPNLSADSACTTDQEACSSCMMVQKMHRMRTYFNKTLNMLEKEYSQIQQTLDNIEAGRTAFSAALHNENSFKCYGPFTSDEPIIYKHVFLNLGGSYNVVTGVFTVPHSGVYSVAVTVYSDAGAPGNKLAACASLQVNGQSIAGSREYNRNDQEDSDTVAVAIHLQAGDKLTVSLPKYCFLCDDKSHYNTFTAFLLYLTE